MNSLATRSSLFSGLAWVSGKLTDLELLLASGYEPGRPFVVWIASVQGPAGIRECLRLIGSSVEEDPASYSGLILRAVSPMVRPWAQNSPGVMVGREDGPGVFRYWIPAGSGKIERVARRFAGA